MRINRENRKGLAVSSTQPISSSPQETHQGAGSFFCIYENKTIVEATTLDQELERSRPISILKIDSEGYDYKVLQAGKETLAKTRYVIVETNSQNIRNSLAKAGFRIRFLQPSGYLLAEKR